MTAPDISFERGNCRAAIFYNKVRKNGDTIEIPNIVITRRYLDKDNQWKNATSFRLNDLPKLVVVATKAYDYLTNRKNRNNQSPAPAQTKQ